MDKSAGLALITKKVKQFEHEYVNQSAQTQLAFNEAMVRSRFIDDLFDALGWDIANADDVAVEKPQERAADEETIKGRADYAFGIGDHCFFVEAKKPKENLDSHSKHALQARGYAYNAKHPVVVLTNFEEFHVYLGRGCAPNKKKDKVNTALIAELSLRYSDYIDRWDLLWATFSRESVMAGSLEQINGVKAHQGGKQVDALLLDDIEQWREWLAQDVFHGNPGIAPRLLNAVVQKTIDRILFLRIAEDREIEDQGQVRKAAMKTGVYEKLCALFVQADGRFNSGLFHFKHEKGRATPAEAEHLTIKISDEPLKKIIERLYFPQGPYIFSVIPADILGKVYEQFLGKVIHVDGKQIIVAEKPEVRKAGGVYYTPEYIVNYIVAHTVGTLLANKTLATIDGFSVVDPACGSGAFLIVAYQTLLDWYFKQYMATSKSQNAAEKSQRIINISRWKGKKESQEWRLSLTERKRILTAHIYGVDIDNQAVEVSRLSLCLKCLEGETKASRARGLFERGERALPDLDGNIVHGNSLIGTDFYQGQPQLLHDDEATYRINAFDWQYGFPQVMRQGGFDCMVGNPPYVDYRAIHQDQVGYLNAFYQSTQSKEKWSLYLPFIELGTKILTASGVYGAIVPNTFLSANFGMPLRQLILSTTDIIEITDVSHLKVFGNVGTYPVLFFYKNTASKNWTINLSKPESAADLGTQKFDKLSQKTIIKNNNQYVLSTQYSKASYPLIAKIARVGVPLKEVVGAFSWGTSITGFKSFKISLDTYEKLNKKDKARYAKVIQTVDIKRYAIEWKKEYVDTSIYSSNVATKFTESKIVIARLTKTIQATIDNTAFYLGKSSFITAPKVNQKFLLAILNSKVLHYFFSIKFSNTHLAGGYLRFDIPYLMQCPIPWIDAKSAKKEIAIQNKIIAFVDTLLEIKQAKPYGYERVAQATEAEIDALVYQLYGLTNDEIKIVDAGYHA